MKKKQKLFSYKYVPGDPVKRKKEQIKLLRLLIKDIQNEISLTLAIRDLPSLQLDKQE